MQPQILLACFATGVHCWLMVNLLSNSTIRSCPAKLLSSLLTSSMYWCMVLFLRVQDLVFPFVEQHEGAVGPFLQLAGVCWMAAQSSVSISLPILYHLQICILDPNIMFRRNSVVIDGLVTNSVLKDGMKHLVQLQNEIVFHGNVTPIWNEVTYIWVLTAFSCPNVEGWWLRK